MMRSLLLTLLALATVACTKDEQTKAEPAKAAPTATVQKPKKVAKRKESPEQLAKLLRTQEDFEDAVELEITEDNLETELEKLEKELTEVAQ